MTNTAAPDLLRSARFRKEREASWQLLDRLVVKTERYGAKNLSYDEARDMATCYRQAMNSLSVARDISLDRALLIYLEQLCARAYLVVYAPQQSLRGLVSRLITHGIPQAVRRSSVSLLIGFLALLIGVFAGYHLYQADNSWYYTFVPGDLSDGRTPDASAEYLRSTIYGDEGGDSDELGAFASFLFSHNTQVAILTFTVGIFLAVPSFLLTFYNGLVLGAFYAMFASKGLGFDLFAWLSIHGVTEMSAICFACAGGARLGLCVLMPGEMSRRDALRHHGGDAVKLVILAGFMLIFAAFIEGFLRQLIQNPVLRLTIGWSLGVLWLAWLAFSGRKVRPA